MEMKQSFLTDTVNRFVDIKEGDVIQFLCKRDTAFSLTDGIAYHSELVNSFITSFFLDFLFERVQAFMMKDQKNGAVALRKVRQPHFDIKKQPRTVQSLTVSVILIFD